MKLFSHEGVDVIVNEVGEFSFADSARPYQTAADAKDAITAINKRKAALNKKKLALKVIGDDGKERVITGVHARNGNLLIKPELETNSYLTPAPSFYPATPELTPLVLQLAELKRQVRALTDRLYPSIVTWVDYKDGKVDDPATLLETRYQNLSANGEKIAKDEQP
jgi:hypothetical protein